MFGNGSKVAAFESNIRKAFSQIKTEMSVLKEQTAAVQETRMQLQQQGAVVGAVQQDLAQLKEEGTEHLAAINENTEEISANYEYLIEVEQKIDRLTARMDELQMMVRDLMLGQIEVTRTEDAKTVKLSTFY